MTTERKRTSDAPTATLPTEPAKDRPEATQTEQSTARAKPAPQAEPLTPVSGTQTRDTTAGSTLTLIDQTDEVLAHLGAARSKRFPILLIGAMVIGVSFIHLNPYVEARVSGYLSYGALFFTAALARRYAAREDAAARRRYYFAALTMFLVSFPLLYYSGPYGSFPCILAIMLALFSNLAPVPYGAASLALLLLPYVPYHLGVTYFGWPERAIVTAQASQVGKLSNFVITLLIYVSAFVFGVNVRRRSTRALKELQGMLRRVAARDALLREARLDLERAAGIGQPGRFTGQSLDGYKLGVLLGRGGMGEIYEAEDPRGASVALKLLRSPSGSSSDVLARFEREAQVTSSLESPHLVRTLSVGTSPEGLPYIVMERLEGADLAQVLRREPKLPLNEVVEMVEQISEGLDSAHRAGIIHRDLKPQNLFLTSTGIWKLLDFGIAATRDAEEKDKLIGTPGYVAPEQLKGAKAEPAGDIHALGAVVYRALTGRPAFSGRDAAEVLRKVSATLPARPSELVEGLSPTVDDVIRVALAKKPQDRMSSARAFAEAFRAAANGQATLSTKAAELEDLLRWHSS